MKRRASPLREHARERLASPDEPAATGKLDAAGLLEALHELRIHQIELEVQHEELEEGRRRLEASNAALTATERRYRELFEGAPVGYLLLDGDGAIVQANRTAETQLTAGDAGLVGRKLSELIAREHQDVYYLQRRAAMRGEHTGPAVVALRALDGELRDFELSVRRAEDASGELRVAIVDVTARERARADRRESERQRRLMADALPVAVGYVGDDGRFEFCNRAFAALHGSPAHTVEGRLIFEVLDSAFYTALRDPMRSALTGSPARFEGEVSFPGAGPRFVSALLAPDRRSDGRVCGFYALIDDRTELERARRDLRNAAAQAALAEERERRALAADLHDDVGQLLSLASMKLRALQDRVGQTGWAAALAEVEELARQARERTASLSFELSPPLLYDVGLVEATEWLADNLQQRYGLRTSIAKSGDAPRLGEATRVTLFRALRELLINVARHAGTDRARVRIESGADAIRVAVEDDGCGFDPDDPAAVSAGFGLRNVLERVHSLQGRVVVDSSPGKGTRISMTVPTREADPS